MTYAKLRPTVTRGEYDAIDAVVFAVDARCKMLDRKWGMGRLPTLVGVKWADKFAAQGRKFGEAIAANDLAGVRKHGEAMERAFAKLDELAEESGAQHGPPDQWEFPLGDDGVVVLVRDIRRVNQVDLSDRPNAQIWSLDEIASVIRAHPLLAAGKATFPGAVMVEPVVASKPVLVEDDLPF